MSYSCKVASIFMAITCQVDRLPNFTLVKNQTPPRLIINGYQPNSV